MTQPLSAASAATLIDNTLTIAVSLIEQGQTDPELAEWIRGGALLLGMPQQSAVQVVAVAVARLARLHHEIEQLADQWAAAAANVPDNPAAPAELLHSCAHELRKLVDDHG